MYVCDKMLLECEPLLTRCDALNGKTRQTHSTGRSFYHTYSSSRFMCQTEMVTAYESTNLEHYVLGVQRKTFESVPKGVPFASWPRQP